ncbi:hypothetical protein D3C73_1334710 [compost metagenome]
MRCQYASDLPLFAVNWNTDIYELQIFPARIRQQLGQQNGVMHISNKQTFNPFLKHGSLAYILS